MDAIVKALDICPLPIQHIHITHEGADHVVLTVEIKELDDCMHMTVEQTAQIENMMKQLINMACTAMSTDQQYNRISIEIAYTSYNDWMDAIGTIILIEREHDVVRIERYDPTIMDTVISYRSLYEGDLLDRLNCIRI